MKKFNIRLNYKTKIASFALLSALFTFALTSCADMFQSKVAYNSDYTNVLSDLVRTSTEQDQLDTPSEIFISRAESATDLTISWTAVENATSYCLERAIVNTDTAEIGTNPPDDAEFEVLRKYVYGTTYTDTTIFSSTEPDYTNDYYQSNYRFYYRVYAENSRKAIESSSPTDNGNYGTLFLPVKGVEATAGKNSDYVTITWEPVDKATGYDIYRTKDDKLTGFEKITTASLRNNVTSYNDYVSEKGVDYYYMVKAKNSLGNTTVASASALGYALKEGAPTQVSVKSATRGTSKTSITVNWEASSGNGDESMFYTVYRSSSADSSKISLGSVQNTTWTDSKNLKTGIYYYYYIKPYYTKNDELFQGALSELETNNDLITSEGFLLSPPTNLTCVKTAQGQVLSFDPSVGSATERQIYTYTLYGSQDNSEYGKLDAITLTEVNNYNSDTGRLSITLDTTVTSLYKYYKVTNTYNDTESVQSEAVSPAPYAATNAVASKAEKVGGEENANGVYPVKITWNKPSNDEPAAYYVYRSDKPDSGFKRITDSPVTDLSYIDANDSSKSQKVYYYKVLALNSLNQGVNYSNTSYGYGALSPIQYLTEYVNTIKRSQAKLTYMHKSSDTDKLNSETINGDLSGTLYYNGSANIGAGKATFVMKYTNYSDFRVSYIDPDTLETKYMTLFYISGNADSNTNLQGNGNMSGTVTATACMYPGYVYYNNVVLTSGKIKGGTYGVCPLGFSETAVSYTYGTW